MNILFITSTFPHDSVGGIEAVTYSLANEFIARGDNCFVAYSFIAVKDGCNIYADSIQFRDLTEVEKIASFIKIHDIKIVINQLGLSELACRLSPLIGKDCKLISCVHTLPIRFVKFMFKEMINTHPRNIKLLIKILIYPLYRIYLKKKAIRDAQNLCLVSDSVVFLSEYFIDDFVNLFDINQLSRKKIYAIPNICKFNTLDDCSKEELLQSKEKTVLVLSRLVEYPKRISHSIKAWEQYVKRNPETKWTLKIVGYGSDVDKYKTYVRKKDVKSISFEGHQNSLKYFKKSAILFMTSYLEGFGMTLTEAQFMGCIPICYESSPAFYDIIENGKTGFFVDNGNIIELSTTLENIINNYDSHINIIDNMLNVKYKFSREVVISKWYNLFNNLSNESNKA